jgi:Carboxypeptidase regulatory-like domain/TonB dependent receptor-like, beta-barrel
MKGKSLLALSALALSLSGVGQAQTTFATLTGRVTDAAGAAAPKTTVTVRNVETGVETSTEPNAEGIYTLSQLKEGQYTLSARSDGFKEFVVRDIQLVARDYRRVDITLEIGQVEAKVEVAAGATLIETETQRISDTRDVAQLRDMPLNSRAIWAQLSLAPNVLQASAGSTIRFSGSRTNQSHWSIDGTTMSDGVTETQIGPLAQYVESFQEIRIDSANNSAEFGTIGQVTMISKAGTNSFHGSLFDYYVTPWFRARNPFALTRDTGVSHLPGGSAGGPVYIPGLYDGRNKTFIFGSFENFLGSQATRLFNTTVPLAAWRSGDFSGLSTPVIDPLTGQAFPGNRIPSNRLNATAVAIQNRFYPLPNFGNTSILQNQNNRQSLSMEANTQFYWTLRGDHRFTASDSIMARYTKQDFAIDDFLSLLPTIEQGHVTRKNHAATVSYTHLFSPTILNEFRWGIATNDLPIFPPINGPEFVSELGLVGLAPSLPDVPGILNVSFAGLGLQTIAFTNNFRSPGAANYLQTFQDHVSISRGRHNMRGGVNYTRIVFENYGADANLFGNLTFSNRFTGFPYADFLLGLPSTAQRSFPPLRQDRLRHQYDFFFTDDFKVSPNLTLNLGVRYEYHPGWTEKTGYLSMFDINSRSIVVKDGSLSKVSPLFPKDYVNVVEASSLGFPGDTLIRTDRNNFAPRVGLAYRPWGNNTVIRGGFGVYFDVVPREATMVGVPFVVNEQPFNNPATNPTVILPRVFPEAGGPASVSLPTAVNPNLQIPYSMQYSLTVEHLRWDTGFRVSYIGTNTRQGEYGFNYNAPLPDGQLYINKPRAFPQYPDITYITNGAGHQFHGFTVEVERRMAKGLQFQSSWVWARDIGDLERGQLLENPYDRRRERSVAPDIPTHRFTTNWIYQLPFGKGRPFLNNAHPILNAVVGGWDVSGIYSYYSGQFLTVLWTGPDPTGTAFTSTASRPIVTIRADQLRDGNLPGDQRSVTRWFDATAFGAPPVGRFGSSAKGVIKGPHVNVWHMGLFKSFYLSETIRLRWELTATNFFNHPNYSNPATNISQASSVGVISGVGGVNGASTGDQPFARNFRMGLRLEW